MIDGNSGGNYFDKYHSKNPLIKLLMIFFNQSFIKAVASESVTSILDIGCGEGHLTNILFNFFKSKKQDVCILGLEYDQNIVNLANVLYPHLDVRKGDVFNLVGKYDLLVCSEVLEHIKDYEKAISSCKNVSEVCIFSVPNEPFFRISNLFRLRYLKKFGNPPGHINNWSRGEFEKLLKKHFNFVEIRTVFLWNIAKCKS
jgi:2-polyprenyl-3-methyl-5-hydroxy-6-metoxy-1,4-benzoquinol methylase